MTFAALNVAVADLRTSLASFVGPHALAEMSVRPPVDGRGEISFLRLVAWSYVLVFEAGRISIPFLLRTSGAYEQQRESMDLIRALRTWCFHNLGLASDRDAQVSRLVHRWFLNACGKTPPDLHAEWNECFDRLCDVVHELVHQCQRAVGEVLSSPDDGQTVIDDLRRRITRFWPPEAFDELVGDLAIRLGIRIDVVKFRRPRLDAWRSFVLDVPEEDDPKEAVARVIERDILEYEGGVLPIGGNEVMARFAMPPGPDVGMLLRHARELFGAGERNEDELWRGLERRWDERRDEGPA